MMTTMLKPAPPSVRHSTKQEDSQLRRDRMTGIVVLIVLGALIALLMWLASLAGGPPVEMDHWPIMM